MTNTAPGIGHNNPPSEIELIREGLARSYAPLIEREAELIQAAGNVPEITTDQIAGDVGDLLKLMQVWTRSADQSRLAEKAPHEERSRAIDGWFRKSMDRIRDHMDTLRDRHSRYLREKEAKRRREIEERAKKEREAAEAARREAAEKEAAALKAWQDAEAKRTEAAREKARQAAAAKSAEANAKLADADVKEQRAEQTESKAKAKPAELARVRGSYGAVSTLREAWVGELDSREELDLEALRHFLAPDHLEAAIAAFVKAGGRKLRGATIRKVKDAAVR